MSLFKDVTSVAFIATVVSGIVSVLVKVWAEHTRDRDMENFRNEITRQQSTLTSSINSQLQAFHAVNEQRIDAVMRYWQDLARILHFVTVSHYADRYLTKDELSAVLANGPNEKYRIDWAGRIHDATKVLQRIDEHEQTIAQLRPLLSEQLWFYHVTLRLFASRVALLYSPDNPSKNWQHWHGDESLVRVVKNALTKEESESVLSADVGSVSLFCHIIEQKVLDDIRKALSGEVASSSTLQNAQRLVEVTQGTHGP